jgi:hypothetical protein
VGGRSDGPASVIRPYLRQWPWRCREVQRAPWLSPFLLIESIIGVSGTLARRGPRSSGIVLLDAPIKSHFDRSGLPRYFDGKATFLPGRQN